MGYFNRDNKGRSGGRSFGGNRSFDNKRSFGGNRGGRPQMHDAVCANCGNPCQVPFLPTGDKPVYCRDCFAKMGGGERRPERNDAPRPAFKKFDAPREATPSRAEFDQLNAKLDKILALLSSNAPQAAAPVAEEVVEKKKRSPKKEVIAE